MTRRLVLAVLALLLAGFLAAPQAFAPLLAPLAANNAPAIYTQSSLLGLTLSHLGLVAAAVSASVAVALGLAILVTRPAGAELLPLARTIAAVGQTFPPVAVLALAVPAFGFGSGPTLLALFLYVGRVSRGVRGIATATIEVAALGFLGAAGTVAYSVAAPALVPSLVPAGRLAMANRWLELTRSTAFAAGPALGGAVVGWAGAFAPRSVLPARGILLTLAGRVLADADIHRAAALLARLPGDRILRLALVVGWVHALALRVVLFVIGVVRPDIGRARGLGAAAPVLEFLAQGLFGHG